MNGRVCSLALFGVLAGLTLGAAAADLELSDGDLTLGFSAKGASLVKAVVGGVDYAHGMPSFGDRVVQERKAGMEMMEDLSSRMFRQDGRYEKNGRKGLVFLLDSTGFKGLQYVKRYELAREGETPVLQVVLQVNNNSGAPVTLVHSTKLFFLVGDGRNTFLMPTSTGDARRYEYPGCESAQVVEFSPKHCGFGVMADNGAGVVFYAPPRRTGGFDSWLSQRGTPCVTEEYWGVNETVEPGKGISYVMKLAFTKDVEGHLAARQRKVGPLLGEPAMHLKKFASPPMKVNTINVGQEISSSFKSPREYLEKAFKIPVDLLEQVNIADVGYHEEWFKPGAPVDILYVYNPGTDIIRNGKRLMSELAARMNITFKTVPMILEVLGTRNGKPYSVYPTYLGEKVDDWSVDLLRKASASSPNVVLLQGHDFAFVQKEVQDMLAAFAKKGSGLVFVDCKNVPETLCGKKRRRVLDSAAMMLPKMCSRRAGIVEFHAPPEGGSFSVLVNTQRHTLNPSLPDDMVNRGRKSLVQSREFPFGDYLQLAVAKAVRIASGLKFAATFDQVGEKGLRIKAKAAGRFTLKMKFKDTFRFVDAEKEQALELREGMNEVSFAPPALPGGVHVCELRLLENGGNVVDAAAFRFDTPVENPVSLAFAETNRIFGAEAPVAFKASVGGVVPQGAKLVAELEDGDFRVLRREERTAADCVEFSFAQARDPGRLERVVTRLVAADGRLLSKAVEEVSVRARPRDLCDTSAYITIDSNPEIVPLLRDLGFDFMINGFSGHPEAIRQTANLGMMSIPRGCAGLADWFRPYRGDNPNGNPVRHPCFSSEQYRNELFKRIGDAGKRAGYDFYNVRYHWLGDECFLGSTVCYSPTCLAGFRCAMEAKYGDIAKLNARWGSSFGSFADVMPCQLKELKDRSNLAPWLEHKMFMAWQFAEKWVGGTKAALNAASPGSFTGPTGTAVPGYGWDWSQMMKHIDAVGYYGGAQRKLIHDFAELYGRQILAGQCGGGYTHAQFDYEPYNYDTMWSGLLKGSNLAYHYFGAAIDGDFTPTSNMVYWATSLAEMKGGIGKMWLSGTYDSKVSVLYSQPSLFTAMATVGNAKWQNSLNSWWRILSDMKISFRFLPYEYLAKGVPHGVKVLVLPMSLALSEAERAAVAQFIARGGKVLADVAPGAYDEAGVKVGRAVAGVETLGEAIADYMSIDLGGAAGETASVKGAAAEEAKRLRGIVGKALQAAGVTPEVSVVGADGAEFACDAPLRRDGDTTLFAMHVDTFGSGNDGSDSKVKGTDIGRFDLENAPKVVAHLPVKGHVYDVRARKYVGFTDTIATTLAPGYTRMYSVLKSKPEPVKVECQGSVKAGEPIRISFAVANAVGPQVFNVRIVDPAGKAPWRFRKNLRSVDGRGEYVFETAFNDTPGEWRAVVTHVNTGSSREVRFTVGSKTCTALCQPALRAADARPALTVGLMSDTHLTRKQSSVVRSRMAMELFKKLGVDVIAHVGDLADFHYKEAYTFYREAMDAVFPPSSRRPVMLYAFGDHDALDPTRRKGPRSNRRGDCRQSFADMAALLGIDHGYSDLKVIAGYPFLIFPETFDEKLTLADYERILSETCAKFPSGPVFVLEHPPAYQTTYNSCFQDPRRRAVLDKFPRVVDISGHKHASVKNELCIWQGSFTAVQASCLQKWYGLNIGGRIAEKESWCVCVMQVFPDRLVFRRYDVRDGVEFRPDAPWTVPLPFAPETAPLTVAARRRTERAAVFPAGAAVSAEVDGTPFSQVGVKFPTVVDPDIVLYYCVEAARRNAGGDWERFVRTDVFGDFYERPVDRKGTLSWNFDSALFDAGGEYRFTVTPVGFFGTEGAPISCLWKAPEKAQSEVVWRCDNPMEELKFVGAAKTRREGDWLVCGPGEFRVDPPPEAFDGRKCDRFTFVVEMHTVQPDAPHGVAFGVSRASWSGGLLTPLGDSGMVRYALSEVLRGDKPGWAFKFAGRGNFKVRFAKLWIERR